MGPPLNESEEVGFDQDLTRPSASSTLIRHPPDRVLDGLLLAVVCRASKRRAADLSHRTYFVLVDGISGIRSSDHPLRRRRLRSPGYGECWPHIRLIHTPLNRKQGGGVARTEPCDERFQMLKLQRRLWSWASRYPGVTRTSVSEPSALWPQGR